MSTPAYVQAIAPEFKTKSSDDITVFIDIAKLKLDAEVWGDKYDAGVAYLAAHLLTMSGRAGVAGAVVREQIGEISTQYSSPKSDAKHDQYLATSYGAEFLSLRNSVVVTPLVRS
jgi:hypothetical protein